jgi:hypothetical protein
MVFEKDLVRAIIAGAVYEFRTKLERSLANTPAGRYELMKNGVGMFAMNSKFVRDSHRYMELTEQVIQQWENQ